MRHCHIHVRPQHSWAFDQGIHQSLQSSRHIQTSFAYCVAIGAELTCLTCLSRILGCSVAHIKSSTEPFPKPQTRQPAPTIIHIHCFPAGAFSPCAAPETYKKWVRNASPSVHLPARLPDDACAPLRRCRRGPRCDDWLSGPCDLCFRRRRRHGCVWSRLWLRDQPSSELP